MRRRRKRKTVLSSMSAIANITLTEEEPIPIKSRKTVLSSNRNCNKNLQNSDELTGTGKITWTIKHQLLKFWKHFLARFCNRKQALCYIWMLTLKHSNCYCYCLNQNSSTWTIYNAHILYIHFHSKEGLKNIWQWRMFIRFTTRQ